MWRRKNPGIFEKNGSSINFPRTFLATLANRIAVERVIITDGNALVGLVCVQRAYIPKMGGRKYSVVEGAVGGRTKDAKKHEENALPVEIVK